MTTKTHLFRLCSHYIPSVLFISCAVIASVRALGFPAVAGNVPGPALVPLLFSIALLVMGVALAVQAYRNPPQNADALKTSDGCAGGEGTTHPRTLGSDAASRSPTTEGDANPRPLTTEDDGIAHPLALPLLVGALVVYVLVMPLLGFISTTVPFLYICLRIFGHGGGVRAWAFSFGSSYAMVFIFTYLMNVPLPSGLIG